MSDILDLIDNAIEAHESWPDAMRWTPEPPEQPKYATGGVIDETHCWTDAAWRDVTEYMVSLPTNVTRVWMAGTTAVTFTLDNREAIFRRIHLDGEVPSSLSRESNPASTERLTDG